MNMCRKYAVAAALAGAAMGCSVGPNYHPPTEDLPARWKEAPQRIAMPPHPQEDWWKTFKDPELDSLIDRAIRSNLDLKRAETRIRETRARLEIAQAPLWPSADASGSYTRLWQDEDVFGPLSAGGQPVLLGQQPENLFQAGFDASWEIDIFGGTRRGVEAARADSEATRYGRNDVLLTLTAEVARNYIGLCGLQRQLKVARDNLAAQRDTLALTRAQYEGGLTSDLDVARAEAQVKTMDAEIPVLETSGKDAIHRLGVLLGQPPGTLTDELSAPRPIPPALPEIPTGVPSDVLRQRPDLRRAERQLAAATARVGVATADLYPKFYLFGTAGLESLSASDFFSSGAQLWSIGPSISWPIFRGGQIVANIEVRDAQEQQALIAYRQAILNALEEAENAFAAYSRERRRNASLTGAVTSNRRAVSLATELYAHGLTGYLVVLDAQRSLFQAERELVQNDAAMSDDFVAVYKALGGGPETSSSSVADRRGPSGKAAPLKLAAGKS